MKYKGAFKVKLLYFGIWGDSFLFKNKSDETEHGVRSALGEIPTHLVVKRLSLVSQMIASQRWKKGREEVLGEPRSCLSLA